MTASLSPLVTQPAPSFPGLWRSVWKLLRVRMLMFFSEFRRSSKKRKAFLIIAALGGLVVVGFVFFLSWTLLTFLRSPQMVREVGDLTPVLEAVPVVVLSASFFGILLTSFAVLLQALYLAGDMEFLLATPTPIRAVFLSKMLQAILPNLTLISAFALPLLIGLGVSSGYSWLYFPLVVLLLVVLALAAAGIASVLVMLIVRIFPARRVAEVLGFLGAIFSFVCSQSANLAQFSDVDGEQTTGVLTALVRLDQTWSPLAWAGRALVHLGEARWLAGFTYLLLAVSVSFGLFFLALVFAERMYYSGWANMQVVKRKAKSPRSRRAASGGVKTVLSGVEALTQRIPAPVRALVDKDFIVLRRDLRHTSNLIMPLIFGVIYAFMFLRPGGEFPAGRGEAPEWFMQAANNALLYGQVILAIFVGWMMVSRLASIGFSQEGKNYWLIKSAPVSTPHLLLAKFLVALLPSLIGSSLFLLAVGLLQQTALTMLIYSLLVVALTLMGNVGINLAFGVAWANFAWEDPRQMARGSNGCISFLASATYLPFSLLLFFGPPFVTDLLQAPHLLGQAIGLLVGGGFTLLCALGPLWLVRHKVAYLAE